MKILYYDDGESRVKIYESDCRGRVGEWLQAWKDYYSQESGLFEQYTSMLGLKFEGKFNPKRLSASNTNWENFKYKATANEEANYVVLRTELLKENKAIIDRNCDYCGNKYKAKRSQLSRGWGLCCSKSCSAKKRIKDREKTNGKRNTI